MNFRMVVFFDDLVQLFRFPEPTFHKKHFNNQMAAVMLHGTPSIYSGSLRKCDSNTVLYRKSFLIFQTEFISPQSTEHKLKIRFLSKNFSTTSDFESATCFRKSSFERKAASANRASTPFVP